MTDGDMWGQDTADVDAFALPGDDQLEQQLSAQATVEAEPETDEAAEPVEGEERARDEQGRFAKKDDTAAEAAAEPDEPAAVEPETPEETAERLIAGQYKTVEEAERALLEKQALIDRQGNELGEWRQYVQQLTEAQQRQAQAPQDWESLIDENPARAAQLAYQHGHPQAYRAAMEAWEELSPGTPAVWVQNVQLQAQMAQTADHQNQQQWTEAMRQFGAEHPGFNEITDDELMAAVDRNPAFAELMRDTTRSHAARLGALKVLYQEAELARGRKSDTLVTAAQDIARVQAETTRQAKEEAILASATANLEGGPKKTGAQLVGEQWRAMDQHLHDGWNP
jgi:hypothetical protein